MIPSFSSVRLWKAIICMLVCSGWAMADVSFAEWERRVDAKMHQLETMCQEARELGIDVSYEEVTLVTARLFKSWARWDLSHPQEIREGMKRVWYLRDRVEAYAAQLPERELRETCEMLDEAIQRLQAVRRGDLQRRRSPYIPLSYGLNLKDGYWYLRQKGKERPVFLSGFVWMGSDMANGKYPLDLMMMLHRTYGAYGGAYVGPHKVDEHGQVTLEMGETAEILIGNLFFGHRGLPKWLEEKYPELKNGATHYLYYDIDNPKTVEFVKGMIAGSVPEVAGTRAVKMGYLLANEPHWHTAKGDWALVHPSSFTMAKFRRYLRRVYRTIDRLNAAWRSQFRDFDSVSLEVPIDPKLRGTPPYYDWCRFNMERVTDWFRMMKTEIRRYDPHGLVHIKLIPGQFRGATRSHGLDFEALSDLEDILGCDAKALTDSGTGSKRYLGELAEWGKRYRAYWQDMVMIYDFLKSLYPDKLVYDSELHIFETNHWRDLNMDPNYIRMILWLGHVRGLGANKAWCWLRNASKWRNNGTMFMGSNMVQPKVMDAYGRAMKELNACSEEVVKLARERRVVRFFYSEASAINDATYMPRINRCYEVPVHRGWFCGWETARSLQRKGVEKVARECVLILPQVRYATSADRQAVLAFIRAGGKVVALGSDNLKLDEHAMPVNDLPDLAQFDNVTFLPEWQEEPVARVLEQVLSELKLLGTCRVKEKNTLGVPVCIWQETSLNGQRILFIANPGKVPATVTVSLRGDAQQQVKLTDLLTGKTFAGNAVRVPVFSVMLLRVDRNP